MRIFTFAIALLVCWLGPLPLHAKDLTSDMVLIKGGCFQMGTDEVHHYELGDENIAERPVHEVCVSDFYMDIYETTQKKWSGVMGEHQSHFSDPDFPVDNISWRDAYRFCKKTGKRLPFEAEWEYAALGGKGKDSPWGDRADSQFVWSARNAVRKPHKVGSLKPNPYGLYDMMGSVWEWVWDWYSTDYYANSPKDNPQGPKERKSNRVVRGLSWVDQKQDFRLKTRLPGDADRTEHFFVGVRCAASVKEK